MDQKLLNILKKSKEIEKATNQKFGKSGVPTNKSPQRGLYEEMGSFTNEPVMVEAVDVKSEKYENLVKNSKLPPEIAKAMLLNPIPQPETVGGINEDVINELNPNRGKQMISEEYSDEDEYDFTNGNRHVNKPVQNRKPNHSDNSVGMSEELVRKMIVQELSNILPKIVENYFDKKIIQENTKLMKFMIKNSGKTTMK